ncbi:hypothetical protein FQN52_005602 [Onygenales sp. PD_12]|nr:hypothetical protein FQN52_005602 [Onygenales sp. PD_12]
MVKSSISSFFPVGEILQRLERRWLDVRVGRIWKKGYRPEAVDWSVILGPRAACESLCPVLGIEIRPARYDRYSLGEFTCYGHSGVELAVGQREYEVDCDGVVRDVRGSDGLILSMRLVSWSLVYLTPWAMIDMSEEFRKRLKEGYEEDAKLAHIIDVIRRNEAMESVGLSNSSM